MMEHCKWHEELQPHDQYGNCERCQRLLWMASVNPNQSKITEYIKC